MKYALTIIHGLFAFFLAAGAIQPVQAAAVDYTLTGTLNQTDSGPASPFDGVAVNVTVSMDSGLSPNSTNVTATFAESNYTPNSVQLTAGGLGPLNCSPSTNVTLRDSVTANDRLTLASCALLTVVMNASVTIGQTLSTTAPAAIASTTATGGVTLTNILTSQTSVFTLVGGSLSASGASPPTMSPSPTSASLMADFGTTTPATQAITLDASSPVSYTVSDSGESWLNATPGAGNTGTAVTISANPTGLSPGTYNGTVSVSSPGQSTINIPVSFEVVGSLPDLTVSPGSLTFNHQEGGAAPAAQQLSVTSGTTVAINVAASTSSGGNWLSATPSSGNTPQTVSVSVNPAGLSPGSYNGTVTVTSAGAGNSPQTANVTLNVTAAPTISLAPSSLTFNYQSGASNPAAQMVNLTATNGPVSYTAAASTTSGGSWLSVTPTSGSSPQSLSVSVNPGALAPGNYSGMVTVTANSASNSPQTVAVTLNVTAAPTISAAPSALSFNFQIGGSNPAAQNVNVTATNGPVSITAAAATSSGGNWLSVSPGSGNTPQALSVSVNPTGLAAGTYNGTVTVTSAAASNSPQVVAVTFTVSAAPTLSVAPGSLTFNYQVGGSAPAAQNISINGSSAIAFNAAASTSSGGSWLSVSPTSGTTNASASVSVNPASLAAGTYNGMITVTSGTAGNSPQTVAVTLVVSAAPTLSVAPGSLTFNYQVGGSTPAAQNISINGSSAIAFSAAAATSSGGSWLSVSPTSGTTNASASVSVNPASLAPGTYNGTVTVTSAAASNSPQTVAVTLNVTAAPTLSVSPSQLSFNYLIGAANPASQSVSVAASPTTPPVSFTAAASGGAWLSVTPTSGSTAATVSVSVNPAGLAPGTYNGTVTVTAASTSNSPQTVAVSLTVTAPTLTVAPAQLSFGFQVGGSNPAAQMVNVTANSATAYTAAASGGAWLSVTPGSGTTDGALSVSVDPTGLAAGTYNGTVTVTAPTAGNSPQAIPVVLTVSAAPVLTVSPSQLTFNFQSGGANPPSQMLNITGSAPLAYNVAASGGAWLSVTPASGNTPGSATVSVNPAGLSPGSYNGTINITSGGAGNSPQTVAVTLVVSSAPTISASPSALTFNYQVGGSNPAPQNVSVGGSSATAFTATASGGAWLSVSPGSGTTDGTVSVSANPSGLAPGTYNGTVTIAAAAAGNSPQVVAVTLVVTAASFTASPAQLSFTYQLGGTNPPSQSVSVSSATASQFSVSAAGGPWISATPANGTTPATVSVSVNPAGLSAGNYNGTVAITPQGAGQSTQIVQVALVVTSAPTISVSPATLAFSYQVGGNVPTARTVSVTATSPINFSAAALGGSWLSVTPASGSTPGSLSISVNPVGLTPGDYVGTVEITSAGAANSPQVVAVSLTVTGPSVTVSPAQLSFSFQTGGNPPAPQPLTLATAGQANFTAAVVSGDFLSITPTSGTAPASVNVSVDPGTLEPGTYTGSVSITPEGGSPVTVPVVFTVSANPILSASPAGLSFQYFVNGAMPEMQAINLTASTEMDFTVAAAGGDWLSVTPVEGTTPASLMASVDPTGLEPGDYAGSIAVTAPDASNSPVTIPVTLTVILAPVFDADGVVTSTEYIEGDSPAGGGLASVFGFFPGIELEQATSVPLPTRIQGLEVRLRPMTSALGDSGAGVAQEVGFVAAPLLFVSPEQINFQAPWEIPPGPVEMIVSAGGVDSAPVEIEFTESNPGVFTFEFGPGHAVAILLDGMVAQPAGSIEGVTTRPARIGEPLVLLTSGLGPLTGPPLPSGANSLDETGAYVRRDTVVQPRVFVGGQEAEVYFAGASPEFVGVSQINLTAIPEGVEPGPAVPLIIEVNGVQSRMDVTIAVDPALQQ